MEENPREGVARAERRFDRKIARRGSVLFRSAVRPLHPCSARLGRPGGSSLERDEGRWRGRALRMSNDVRRATIETASMRVCWLRRLPRACGFRHCRAPVDSIVAARRSIPALASAQQSRANTAVNAMHAFTTSSARVESTAQIDAPRTSRAPVHVWQSATKRRRWLAPRRPATSSEQRAGGVPNETIPWRTCRGEVSRAACKNRGIKRSTPGALIRFVVRQFVRFASSDTEERCALETCHPVGWSAYGVPTTN